MTAIDWNDFGIYDSSNLPTDWRYVLTLDEGGGYNWATLHAFWSPSARRFFWLGNSGCSCTSWSDDLRGEADFENGDKAALRRALRGFADAHCGAIKPSQLVDTLDELARFKPEPRQ